jgi:endonuclease/exonuclease/phosphatase (EEP) superfamily protein YafD
VLRAAILAAALPVLGWLGRYHWVLDLFNHFQAQYFGFLLVCTLALAVWRKWRHLFICLILLGFPAANLAPLYIPTGFLPDKPSLRVSTFNILGTNTRYAKAVEWILKADPDFIYLPETNDDWKAGLAPLDKRYPHQVDCLIEGNFGFSFRSKFPMAHHQIHRPGNMEIPLLHAVVSTPQGEVTVLGAHPVPPVTGFWARERDIYLHRMNEIALETKGRLVILGDLNATRWSSHLTPFFEQGLRDSADGKGYSATWMRENPLMTVPIDHILSRGFSGTKRRETGPALGSDHRPVIAELVW